MRIGSIAGSRSKASATAPPAARSASGLKSRSSRVERLRPQHLAPGEGEKLLGQLLAAPRRAHGRLGQALHALDLLGPTQHHVEPADDDGEQVVEVVRHAAGELPDRFHFLGLAQSLLGEALVGAVHQDAGDPRRRIALVADPAPERDPAHLSVGAPDAALEVERAGLASRRESALGDVAVLLDDVRDQALSVPVRARLAVPEDGVEAGRAPRRADAVIEVPGRHAGGVEGEGEGLVSGLDLPRALGHAPLEILVGEPELRLSPLALQEMLASLVLAAARPKGGGRGADERLGIHRALEQHDIGEPGEPLRRTLGAAAGLAGRQHDEGEIRPGRLRIEPREQVGEVTFQRLLGDEGGTSAGPQAVEPARQVGTSLCGRAGPGEHLPDHCGIAPPRRQDQDALLVRDRHAHASPPAGAWPVNIATLPR
jgi:hypothetical protein